MKNIKIYIINPLVVSLLFGCLFWVVDGLVEHYYFRDFIRFLIMEGPETPAESILFKVSPHGLFVRISVLIASGIGGLWMWYYLIRLRTSKKELKKFKTISDDASSGTIIFSLDGEILYINNAYARMHGRNPEELKGKLFTAIFSEQQLPRIKELNQMLMEKGSFNAEEVWGTKKDGAKFPTLMNATVIKDDNQSPLFFSATIIDLSKQKNIEKEKIKLEQSLLRAQKIESIGTLAGGIAHDFNNILFPIVGHSQILLEEVPEDSEFRESLIAINKSALRAKQLVKQILTFSRQERSELKLMKMQPILKESLKLIRSTIPANIEIKQNISTTCGIIKADSTQIHQIIMNLATNAYHAMEETGGKLRVELKQVTFDDYGMIHHDINPGEYAHLSVIDNGIGMDKEMIEKIFDPFFTTKESGKGTGMGLSVVHGIVNSMAGAIQVNSMPAKGTEIHVYIPVEKGILEEADHHINQPIQFGTGHIMLVDDEEDVITIEKLALKRLGYQVTSFTNSLEALEMFCTSPDKFDMVITDMAMPNMQGDILSGELIKIQPDIPILLCTGYSETMSTEKAASLGIKGFLMKPIAIVDLSRKIHDVLC